MWTAIASLDHIYSLHIGDEIFFSTENQVYTIQRKEEDALVLYYQTQNGKWNSYNSKRVSPSDLMEGGWFVKETNDHTSL